MTQSESPKRFSSAMEQMGNPAEMSPIGELTNLENQLPFVEVTAPLPLGELDERKEPLQK